MARPKSFLTSMAVDKVKKSHNCQNNPKHRLTPCDKRLKVSNGRSHDHYCAACAITFISRDIHTLRALLDELAE